MSSHDPMNGGAGEHGDPETAAILERFGTTLRRAAVWEDPPDDLDDRIMAEVAALAQRRGSRRRHRLGSGSVAGRHR